MSSFLQKGQVDLYRQLFPFVGRKPLSGQPNSAPALEMGKSEYHRLSLREKIAAALAWRISRAKSLPSRTPRFGHYFFRKWFYWKRDSIAQRDRELTL